MFKLVPNMNGFVNRLLKNWTMLHTFQMSSYVDAQCYAEDKSVTTSRYRSTNPKTACCSVTDFNYQSPGVEESLILLG